MSRSPDTANSEIPSESDVIYDWNRLGGAPAPRLRPVGFHDETLRDGLQCPSVTDPPIEAKKQVIRLLDQAGVHTTDVGLPGAGPRAVADVTVLTELIRDEKLAKLTTEYEDLLMNPKEALSLGSVSRIVMPGESRRILSRNLDFLMRKYTPEPMGGPQREHE